MKDLENGASGHQPRFGGKPFSQIGRGNVHRCAAAEYPRSRGPGHSANRPRQTGRVRATLVVALALLAALGAVFYFFYVVRPDAALSFAETFQFRRMTVAQSGQDRFQFHYVTNRVLSEAPSDDVAERFGVERSSALEYGYFETHIEPALGIGMLLDSTAWFQNEEIHLDAVTPLSRQALVERVRDRVDASPHRGLLVVVHGFREAFDSALRKTAFLSHVIDLNAPVLVFDWPGNQGSSLRGYRRARQVAKASGADLAQALEVIINDVRPRRLWLLANSMGAEVVANAFSELYANADFSDAETEIRNVVLTAPDVDAEEFDLRFKEELLAIADEVTVYVSSNDRALLVSRAINRGQRLGESTASPDQLAEAVAITEFLEPDGRVTLVDVTPVNRTRNFHNFSLETPEFFDDLFLRLSNESTPSNRLIYAVETPGGRTYWVLTRGRR